MKWRSPCIHRAENSAFLLSQNKILLASIIGTYMYRGTLDRVAQPSPVAPHRAEGEEGPLQGAVLTAVRQGTAEDRVRQQAPRGSTRGAVHEAVLTVTAGGKTPLSFVRAPAPAGAVSSPATHPLPLQLGSQSTDRLKHTHHGHQ